MKKLVISIGMFAILGVFSANAQVIVVDSVFCGANLTWKLTSDSVLTISGSGAMDDCEYYGG